MPILSHYELCENKLTIPAMALAIINMSIDDARPQRSVPEAICNSELPNKKYVL